MYQHLFMLEEEVKSLEAASFKVPFSAATDWSSSFSMKKLRFSPKPAIVHDLGLHSRPTQIVDALADAYGYPLMGSCLEVI